jgi:hypothetical protein
MTDCPAQKLLLLQSMLGEHTTGCLIPPTAPHEYVVCKQEHAVQCIPWPHTALIASAHNVGGSG